MEKESCGGMEKWATGIEKQTLKRTCQNTGIPHTIKPEIQERVLEGEEGPFTACPGRAGSSSQMMLEQIPTSRPRDAKSR